ncbi:hypothetical protein U1872_06260 [Sphingomonas sp. RB3P16]|uniref:hypothetical protein n=1 Tax=Parasphingomonas frigoris TaxID=3096163 RepID=UPI002FCA72EB
MTSASRSLNQPLVDYRLKKGSQMTRAEQRRLRFGRDRTPGFTRSPSKRINAAMQAMAVAIALERNALDQSPLSVIELQKEAVLRVAKTLPAAPASKLYRYRPSRSDNPIYRGQNGDGPRRLAAAAAVAAKPKRVRAKKVASA